MGLLDFPPIALEGSEDVVSPSRFIVIDKKRSNPPTPPASKGSKRTKEEEQSIVDRVVAKILPASWRTEARLLKAAKEAAPPPKATVIFKMNEDGTYVRDQSGRFVREAPNEDADATDISIVDQEIDDYDNNRYSAPVPIKAH